MKDIGQYFTKRHKTHVVTSVFISILLVAGFLTMSGCGKKQISLAYDHAPDQVIIQLENGGGLPFPGDDSFPLFQLLGDGVVIKYEGESNSRGIFVQGKLDDEDMQDLLQGIYDTGFFSLEDEYDTPTITDAVYAQITVDLVETEKSVRVWMLDVPAFDAAYDLIMEYPIGETSDYLPQEGYLVVAGYPRQEDTRYDFLDPGSEVYKLLPDAATLAQAAADHTAIAIDGETFLEIKRFENAQKNRGLTIELPDQVLEVYPVYEPRSARME
jgi:hypothetical protein